MFEAAAAAKAVRGKEVKSFHVDDDEELAKALYVSEQQYALLQAGLAKSAQGACAPAGGSSKKMLVGRSLSMANPELADIIREKVNPGSIVSGGTADSSYSYIEPSLTSVQNTLVLPPFTSFSRHISSYLYWRLLDVYRLERLQACGAINSLPNCESVDVNRSSEIITTRNVGATYSALLPMTVMGDGNCCLHSCSVQLWGVQDRRRAIGGRGTVRSSLHRLMTQQAPLFFQRWQQQEQQWDLENARVMGLTEAIERQPEEWEREWRDILERSGRDGAFLMEIHIYVLAHVLRRPIIVYSDAVQQDSPCRMRGIYLPLEWSGTGMELETNVFSMCSLTTY